MEEWPTGKVERLSPLVRRLLAPNPSPFTYTGTQTYVLGSGEVAVIDPGPDLPQHIEVLLDVLGDEKVAAIVCTHTHRDHSPASRALQAATGAPIVGCAPLTLEDDGPRADAAFDPDYRPDRVLEDGETIAGEGWTLEAVATPGHTSNHLCFSLLEERALFSGDHVMGWSTTVVSPPDGDMALYMQSLERLLARDDVIYYPAHGPSIEKPQRLVRGLIGHRKQREGQILRHLKRGQGRIPAMVTDMYKGIDPRLHPAAGRSVLAHLIDLEARGVVRRVDEEWSLAA
ncbi:MAG TPA: MBL fold metallo-hydrolase [Allosphingosinicella sp.]|uniref:MBL fold metallo-hydrolase n=1 Tax=Allosphingosinicella sp. TaxID=2823234 RepID=UPI002ED8BDA8